MNFDFEYLLAELYVHDDPEHGPSINCIDLEHLDYVDDVLTDKFDCEPAYVTSDDQARRYILHFGQCVSKEELSKNITAINSYHQGRQSTYKTSFNNS